MYDDIQVVRGELFQNLVHFIWNDQYLHIRIIIICDIYIVPYSARSCSKSLTILFTILLSPTQTCFHPAHISTTKGAYNACCHYRHKALLKHIAIASCQVLIFLWMSEPVTALQRSLEPVTVQLRDLRSNNCTISIKARYIYIIYKTRGTDI